MQGGAADRRRELHRRPGAVPLVEVPGEVERRRDVRRRLPGEADDVVDHQRHVELPAPAGNAVNRVELLALADRPVEILLGGTFGGDTEHADAALHQRHGVAAQVVGAHAVGKVVGEVQLVEHRAAGPGSPAAR